MPSYTCACGARYKLPDGSGGKRARCKKCGVVFTVPEEEIQVAPPDDDYWDFEKDSSPPPAVAEASRFGSPAAGTAPETAGGTSAGRTAAGSHSPEELVALGRAAAADAKKGRGFWGDIVWTFALFTEPNNLAMLVLVWILHGLLPFLTAAGCIGLVGYIIVLGWLCSYWFNVIVEAANGEDRLPSMGLTEGVVDDVILPLLKFVGAWLLVFTPAIVCAVIAALALGIAFGEALTDPTGVLVVLVGVAMFLWPMVLLVTAIGGIFSVVRVDLIFMTIARTFLPYLAVCLLFAGAWALEGFADELAALITGGGLQNFWITTVVTALLQAYFSIVSMRIVGLYYHHFKSRFAWSWG